MGDKVFNVLFILGVAALITPLAVHRQVIRQEAPIMIGGAVLLIVLGLDGSLGLFDGSLLLGLLMAYTAFLVRQSRAEPAATGPDEYADTLQPAKAGRWDARLPAQLGLIVAGLVLLDPMARTNAPGFRLGQFQLLLHRGPAGWVDIVKRRLARRGAAPRATDDQLRDWPAAGAEAAQLASLVARGAELFVLFTGGAANYFTHPRQFFAGYGPAARSPKVHFDYWRQCDHLFFQPDDRERLVDRLAEWLGQRFGAPA